MKRVFVMNFSPRTWHLGGRWSFLKLDVGYRLDIVVENSLVLEIKAVEKMLPIHEAQLLTYLRLSGCRTGLVINFNVPVLKNGIKRMRL